MTPALLTRADIAPAADLRLGASVIRVSFGDLALPDTAFPHLTLVRQMDVERVLADALAGRGVEVERGTELAAMRDEPGGVRAILPWRRCRPPRLRVGARPGCTTRYAARSAGRGRASEPTAAVTDASQVLRGWHRPRCS